MTTGEDKGRSEHDPRQLLTKALEGDARAFKVVGRLRPDQLEDGEPVLVDGERRTAIFVPTSRTYGERHGTVVMSARKDLYAPGSRVTELEEVLVSVKQGREFRPHAWVPFIPEKPTDRPIDVGRINYVARLPQYIEAELASPPRRPEFDTDL